MQALYTKTLQYSTFHTAREQPNYQWRKIMANEKLEPASMRLADLALIFTLRAAACDQMRIIGDGESQPFENYSL